MPFFLPTPALLQDRTAPQRMETMDTYSKAEYDIPMRDGVKLRTVVYTPKNVPGTHPILMERTPYGAGPYGADRYKAFRGSHKLQEAGYIFAFQDVRGKNQSEGDYVNIRPQLKPGEKGIDESTDTYDAVEWMAKNVPANNGAVGLWGISYPGFYAGVGAINSAPHLKAVSPQAPVSNWFLGDDVHHNGAFFVEDNFNFSTGFDVPRTAIGQFGPRPTVDKTGLSEYDFFLKAGTAGSLDADYYKGLIPYWTELVEHPNYDEYWKDRSLPDHMKGVKCAVLTVGGWFDAEDMWGALNVYKQTEKQNNTPNFLVMGPWYHGMWASPNGTVFGDLDYGQNTSKYYQDNVEFPFFEKYLRGQNVPAPAEATVFETGSNQWKTFPSWPPKGLKTVRVYLGADKTLGFAPSTGADSFVNDPAAPTPYLADYKNNRGRTREYMVDDQRWAEARPDVLTFVEKPNPDDHDVTVAGPIDVDFWVATTGTDMDLVVKVIDVYPADSTEKTPVRTVYAGRRGPEPGEKGRTVGGESMANYLLNVKADVFRARFRDSFEKPEPFVPGQPTHVHFKMNDLLHTFRKGHRLMVQVQGSWFPLVDRNPNTFVPNIELAKPEEFQKATVTVLHDAKHPSSLTFGTLK